MDLEKECLQADEEQFSKLEEENEDMCWFYKDQRKNH